VHKFNCACPVYGVYCSHYFVIKFIIIFGLPFLEGNGSTMT